MNRVLQTLTLVRQTLRASRWQILALCALVFAFFSLGSYLFRTFGETNRDAMSSISPEFLIALFGGVLGGFQPVDLWLVTLFAHPLLMVSLTATLVAPVTRDLAGAVDRGTLDLVLGCPVPRWTLPLATWLGAQVALLGLCTALWAAVHVGGHVLGRETTEGAAVLAALPRYRPVMLQLWLLGQSVLGVSLWLSARESLHGRALARVLGFVIFSYFLNLLAGLWDLVAPLRWLSVFHYYQPQPILSGQPQLVERLVLAGLALLATGAAVRHFQRRDIDGV